MATQSKTKGVVQVSSSELDKVPVLSDFDRMEIVDKAFNNLSAKNGFGFASVLYEVGYPILTSGIPTAAVATRGSKVELWFNPRFLDWLAYKEGPSRRNPANVAYASLQTVLAHEALHFLFGHASRCGPRKHEIWNQATDCAINLILEKAGQFTKRLYELRPATVDNLRIPKTIQQGNAEEIYAYLYNVAQMPGGSGMMGCGTLDVHDPDLGDTPADADVSGETKDLIKRAMESREHESEKTRDLIKRSMEDRLAEDTDGQEIIGGQQGGTGATGEQRLVQAITMRYNLSWDEILARRIANEYYDHAIENWMPSRKIRAFYPNIILPSDQEEMEKKKYRCLVAADASGSISSKQISKMNSILATLPKDRLDLIGISFDEEAYPIDIDKFNTLRGGGGTRFQSIEEYALKIEKEKGRYPDIIVVFTDGYNNSGRMETPQHPEKYVWIIIDGDDRCVKGIGDVLEADKHFIKETV